MSNVQWGKRPRDGDGESFVRFSELTAQQKLQRRREERAEKKDHSRTMSYFTSIQRALDAQTAQSADPGSRSSLVGGFFSELMQQLKADRTLHLLRNGTVCRVIEAALMHAQLLQAKSLLFVLLGHIPDLVTSPVASFVLETTVWAMVRGCVELAKEEGEEPLTLELLEGGAGVHAGSGVPSCATMLRSFADELCECMTDILHHDIATRALRSIVFLLGGMSFTGPEGRVAAHVLDPITTGRKVVFIGAIDQIAESFAQAIQTGGARTGSIHNYDNASPDDHNTNDRSCRGDTDEHLNYDDTNRQRSASEDVASLWLNAAQTSNSSLILQSLIRIAPCGSAADMAIRQRLGELECTDTHGCGCRPLLTEMLRHSIGCHVFQAFIAAPVPPCVITAGDAVAQRKQGASTTAGALLASMGVDVESVDDLVKCNTRHDRDDAVGECGDAEPSLRQGVLLQYDCCWGKSLRLLEQTNLDELICFGSPAVQSMGHVLHDLLLYAPTAIALQLAWTRIVQPRLGVLLGCSALSGVLTALTRKCAFAGSLQSSSSSSSAPSHTGGGNHMSSRSKGYGNGCSSEGTGLAALIPPDIDGQLHMDESQGVRFFEVAVSMQTEVCAELAEAMVKLDKYGGLQYLCVKASLAQRGYELARNILHMHPNASLPLRESTEKLRQCDLIDILKHARGSVVFQQLLRAAAMYDISSTSSGNHSPNTNEKKKSRLKRVATDDDAAKRNHNSKDRSDTKRNAHHKKSVSAAAEANRGTHRTSSDDRTPGSLFLERFLRRIRVYLTELVEHRHASYVVEVLYEVAPVATKMMLMQYLVPIYQKLQDWSKHGGAYNVGTHGGKGAPSHAHDDGCGEGGHATGEGVVASGQQTVENRSFIARKVLVRCCVEQYLHRPEDWKRMVERQWQVQKLMHQIILQA